jgi:hypothetical protein
VLSSALVRCKIAHTHVYSQGVVISVRIVGVATKFLQLFCINRLCSDAGHLHSSSTLFIPFLFQMGKAHSNTVAVVLHGMLVFHGMFAS